MLNPISNRKVRVIDPEVQIISHFAHVYTQDIYSYYENALDSSLQMESKGSFKNYVTAFLALFRPPPYPV